MGKTAIEDVYDQLMKTLTTWQADHPQTPLTASELADLAGLNRQTVSKYVDRIIYLQQAPLIIKNDTPKGYEISVASSSEQIHFLIEKFWSALSSEQQDLYRPLLRKISRNE